MKGLCEHLKVQYRKTEAVAPRKRNPRTHSAEQIRKIADSVRVFGFVNPILLDANGEIVAGHGRLEAARLLGLPTVPTIELCHLTPDEVRAYVVADNRLAELAGWDKGVLAIELQSLASLDLDFDVSITGFATTEIDLMIEALGTSEPDPLDDIPEPDRNIPPISRTGDIWRCGDHRIACADARDVDAYSRLLGRRRAQLVVTDPPYNVPVRGHVSGLGATRHREFVMASGEMTDAEFSAFLRAALGNLATFSIDGAIHFVFMDWRHADVLRCAAEGVYAELKNLCIWVKTNAGMGALYRSQHELIFVYKNGTAAHINNVELGRHGRYRTNVWTYPGMNTFREGRDEDLALHPTVKPTSLVADAILDCSKRGGAVLDCFGGSGTTMIAAEKTGRRGFLLELDPAYVDVTVARFEKMTSSKAVHDATGKTFAEMCNERTRDLGNEGAGAVVEG